MVCLVKKVCDIFMKVRRTWFYESFTSVLISDRKGEKENLGLSKVAICVEYLCSVERV